MPFPILIILQHPAHDALVDGRDASPLPLTALGVFLLPHSGNGASNQVRPTRCAQWGTDLPGILYV